MSEETRHVTLESLGLSKPLENLTVEELRGLCAARLPMIRGAEDMDRTQLLAAVMELLFSKKEAEPPHKGKGKMSRLKAEIRRLTEKKAAMTGRQERAIMRRKISRLKKQTRRSGLQV